jgi:hypothetical protein
MIRVLACKANRDYELWLRFSDGIEGSVDLSRLLDIGCFKLWRDVEAFLEARPHPQTGAAWWPVGVSLNAEILHADLRARGARAPQPARDRGFQRFMARALEPVKGLRK